MMAADMTRRGGGWAKAALWLVKIATAALFAYAASGMLAGRPGMVAVFGKIGLGQWFRVFTGVAELIGAAMIVWPATAFYGATVLAVIMVGAVIAQVGPLHGDILHVLYVAAPCAGVAWAERPGRRRANGFPPRPQKRGPRAKGS